MFKMKKKGLILVGALSMLALASCGKSEYRDVKENETLYVCIYEKETDTAYITPYNYESFNLDETRFDYKKMMLYDYNVKEDFSKYMEDNYIINENNFTFDGSISEMILKYSNEKHMAKWRIKGNIDVSYNDDNYTLSKTYKNLDFINITFKNIYSSIESIPYENIVIDKK